MHLQRYVIGQLFCYYNNSIVSPFCFDKIFFRLSSLILEIVDTVLEEDDLDDDGYLTYPEYVFARKREEARERSEKLREEKEKHKPKH